MNTLRVILAKIQSCPQRSKTKLIAIDGLGGSGKTTFVYNLKKLCPEFEILSLDHFPCLPEEYPYSKAGAQTRVSLDRFEKQALEPLKHGEKAVYENTFWWPTDEQPQKYEIRPGGPVLIEGCYSFHTRIRKYYDYSIWIQCSPEQALSRAVKRDGESGREIWEKVHAPNEMNYMTKQSPHEAVDIVVDTSSDYYRINKEF